jgi:hypothetical protein
MATDSVDFNALKDQLNQAKSIFVLFGQYATVDHVAAALGLYLVLKEAGKDVFVASPAELRAEFSRLVGLDKISKTIGNRNLVIAFKEFDFSNIEKISHNDGANNRFELIIQPKSGNKPPITENVEFSYRGADTDLIYLIGTTRLEDLGPLYEADRNIYNQAAVISFNRRQNPNYPATSIIDNQASSLSEIVYQFIEQMGLPVKDDIASNFLAGIDFATNRFQNLGISADAFMTAGKLIQNGARRQPPRITSTVAMPGSFPAFGSGSPFPTATSPMPFDLNPSHAGFARPNRPPKAPQLPPEEGDSQAENQVENKDPNPAPPSDWLKPKIFKGGGSIE